MAQMKITLTDDLGVEINTRSYNLGKSLKKKVTNCKLKCLLFMILLFLLFKYLIFFTKKDK
jgi:hypothetical protein